MRIVVNDIAASKGGAMTVLKDFYECVRDNDTENEWIFLLGDNYLEETDNIKVITLPEVKKSRIKRLIFDKFSGRKFIKTLNPDVVFSMQNTIVYGLRNIPQLIYMHQSIPFQTIKSFSFFKSSERSTAIIQHIIGRSICKSVRNATKIIVQTEWIRDAVIKKCGIPRSRIVNILPPVKDLSDYANGDIFDKTKFFYPTAPAVYKNNSAVYKASEMLSADGIAHEVKLTIAPQNSRGAVKCVGRMPFEDVLREYNGSTLVFPSYIETVGLPMLEARSLGSLILASDCPFSREVLKDYENAYFFDPFKPDELAMLMKKVISGEIIKKAVAPASSEPRNTWKDVMDEVTEAGKQK